MKKALILAVFFTCTSLAVSAQGFYLDVGLGLGKAWTVLNGYDVADDILADEPGINEMAVDLSLKAGYGPFGTIPLYVVGEIGGIGHRLYDRSDYMQFNSYIIGPGVLFYPIPLIQLASSIGYSFVANQSNDPEFEQYYSKSRNGVAWNISAAVDIGKSNHACLIGIKYFYAHNTLQVSNVVEESAMVSIFVKYAFRKKPPSLF